MTIFGDNLMIDKSNDIKIVRAHRLGKKQTWPGAKPRFIIVKFHWYGDRIAVWKAKKKLRGRTVFVNEVFKLFI